MESLTTGNGINDGSILSRGVRTSPETTINIEGVKIKCLLDTGAQVSTITESFYRRYLENKLEVYDLKEIITISAAKGSDIPYLGFVEATVQINNQNFKNLGFLVVKDSTPTTNKEN